jgi:hypothetical protein
VTAYGPLGSSKAAGQQGLEDLGGSMTVYQGNSPLWETATFYASYPWQAQVEFGIIDPGYYWVIETGNGVVYEGDSPLGGPLHYDP